MESSNYGGSELSQSIKSFPPDFTMINNNITTLSDVCVLGRNWTYNYYHFLTEVMDKLLLLEKWGYKGKYLVLDSKFAREFFSLSGIPESRIIWDTDIISEKGGMIRITNVICPESVACCTGRTTHILTDWAKKTTEKLCQTSNGPSHKRVFVKRISCRRLYGADEILSKYNFFEIIPEKLTVNEQIQYFYNADVIFSPHGANSTNCLFMRPNTTLIESFGCDYVHPCCIPIIKRLGLNYSMIVEDTFDKELRLGKDARKDVDMTMRAGDDYTLNKQLLDIFLSQL